MIAIDTNVLVRLVTADDAAQAQIAAREISRQQVWLCKTVLLEAEWVLRFSYELGADVVAEAFRRVLGLEGLQVEDRAAVLLAIEWYGAGLDFADALHLASSIHCEAMVTFDRRFVRAAARLEAKPKVDLLR